MTPDTNNGSDNANPDALDLLMLREEVLQICFWYEGEGFGDQLTPKAVLPFMQANPKQVAKVFDELVLTGEMLAVDQHYAFSDDGKRKAARMFAETFTEFQLASHGECNAGCCDGDEPCTHDHDGHEHVHAHGHG